jgi:hypothetical protein
MPAPTPTLYKPAHDSRARDCCARRATHPHLAGRVGAAANGDPAERILWVTEQNQRRKYRKCRKPLFLRK